ncbi:MAG TPA: AI-2E family transporter [Segeticoccus sp.]|uniref:AI-2E family transporter n=1 Tax=Segeticoccus sp. TaxID=2706531 RepID=UPI002D7E88F7|nr:AI-2E family transporter [Segeticoccus sp.]HET8599798.1 AI-2E family transporter [Segeticoccus sp.]
MSRRSMRPRSLRLNKPEGNVLQSWSDYRRRQRAALRESNRRRDPDLDTEPGPDLGAGGQGGEAPWTDGTDEASTRHTTEAEGAAPGESAGTGATRVADHDVDRFGHLGRPLSRSSPFYVGFVGALGVLVAYGLVQGVTRLATVLTLLLVAFFLTLALNPIVESLTKRQVRRSFAVTLVFLGVIVAFVAIGFLVVPPVVQQATQLATNAPTYVDNLLDTPLVQRLDQHYDIAEKVRAEVQKRVTDGQFVSTVAGGVFGAGKALVSGLFSTFTVLILTLYLLASLPRVKHAAYAMVPASRRPRVASLSEEIMRRAGSYAIGQAAVAAINAVCSWIMMTILGIPYAAVLAVVVGFLGLIPMVGATLGALLVFVVALFSSLQTAIIVAVYYVVYQQIENYVIVPKIMQRTVSVPGAVTVVAALAGGTLLGVLGALLAIPVAAGLLLIYEEVLIPRQRRA